MTQPLPDHPRPGFDLCLSHCTACAESWHGGWVEAPCAWGGCELRADIVSHDPAIPQSLATIMDAVCRIAVSLPNNPEVPSHGR